MIRFFEPELDRCWSVSAPSDQYRCSRTMDGLHAFPVELIMQIYVNFANKERSKVLSVKLFTVSGNSTESRTRSSSVASEPERLNSFHAKNILNDASQDCKSFHFESSSPGRTFFSVNPAELRASGFACHQDQAIFETKKQRKRSTIDHQRERKRFKFEHDNKQQDLRMAPTMKASTLKKSQKLGDKITALQQLVSPFGKTDTASVLQEACAQIKVLHEQIRVLSSRYFGAKASYRSQDNIAEEKFDLKRKDLCLVSMSSIMKLSDQETNH
ncbi:transcription factor bHLH112-like [Asparagus officinalis]|uniref:transcription factor bHLH112-like n=1 Tax=Asparagus officinalis TaxID=4686 RepID=UPI00098E3620|nr:transcription factor bHLH112-like [Asparagus officinalis]